MASDWTCYLLRSLDTNKTYIGATNDLPKRIATHNAGKGAKYTRGQAWIPILHVTGFESKNACLSFESGWKKCHIHRSNKRLSSIQPIINLSYANKSDHDRIVDLLYFLYHATYIDQHYVLDSKRKHPLFLTSLCINIFQESQLLSLEWPHHVTSRMVD